MKKRVLFLARKNHELSNIAEDILRQSFDDVVALYGNWGDPYPQEIINWKGDIIVSFLSRWIVKENDIKKAKDFAINFHPAPPEYPGIGGYNFAILNRDKTYGVTCHHMAKKVDSGPIIEVLRFPLLDSYGVDSLMDLSHQKLLELFKSIFQMLSNEGTLPVSEERWSSRSYSRKELNNIYEISLSLPTSELEHCLRSTISRSHKPFILLNGKKYFIDK